MRHPTLRSARKVTLAMLASVLVFASMPNALAHPGDVDGTFGTGGWTGITDSVESDRRGGAAPRRELDRGGKLRRRFSGTRVDERR